MGRKKKTAPLISQLGTEEFRAKQQEYLSTLKTNPQYSLLVDPENKYDLDNQEKEFIGLYCEFKNIEMAAMMSKMDLEKAFALFSTYACQQEIRRINVAMYQTQFANKLIGLEELGGYLSSLLEDNVPVGDRISSQDKLQVAKLILDLHKYLKELPSNPVDIIDIPVEEELRNLSVNSIKALIEQTRKVNRKDQKDKEEIINSFADYDKFTQEEISFLRTLSTRELLDLLNSTEKEVK